MENTSVHPAIKKHNFEAVINWWNNPLSNNNQNFWLLMIILCALAIRVWFVLALGYGVRPDTYDFLIQAHDLANGDWARWFYINRKPPVYSFLLALGIKAGFNEMLFAKSASVLMGLIILHPAWLILGRLVQGPKRLVALSALAFFTTTVETSATTTADSTYGVILLYSFYFALCKGLLDQKITGFVIAGMFLGVAFLTRSEAIIYLPLITLFGVWGALTNNLKWKTVFKSMLYPIVAIMVLAPQVFLLCQYEGRFLLRRNAANLIAKSIDEAQISSSPAAQSAPVNDGNEPSKSRRLLIAAYRMIVAVIVNSLNYISDKILRAIGYISALFLIIGLIAYRKKLIRFSPESMTFLVFVWTFVVLSPIEAHSRFLVGVLPMITAEIAAGIIVFCALLLQNKPAGLNDKHLVKLSVKNVITCVILALIVPTSLRIATRDFYDGTDIVQTAKVFTNLKNENPGIKSQTMLTNVRESSRLKYITAMTTVLLDQKKAYTINEIEQIVIKNQGVKFLTITEKLNNTIFPDFPVLPQWAKHMQTCQTHPKARKMKQIYIFEINRGQLPPN